MKKIRKARGIFLPLAFFWLVFPPPSLRAESECIAVPCDLDQIFLLALDHTGTARIQNEREGQASSAKSIAYSGFLPNVSLDLSHLYRHSDTYRGWYMPTLSATVHQTIFSGFDDFSNVDRAEQELERIRMENGRERLLLYEELASIYFDLLKTGDLIRKRKEALQLSKDSLGLLYRRQRLGRSRTSEVLQEQAYTAKLEATLESLFREEALLKEELSYYTGIAAKAIRLKASGSEELPLPDLEEALEWAAARPDVRAAAREVDLAKAESFRSAGAFLPEVYVEGEYFFLQDEAISTSGPGKGGWNVEVGVSFPLFTGGSRFFERSQALSRVRETGLIYDALLRSAKMEIKMAYVNLDKKTSETEKYRTARDLAEKYYFSIVREASLGMVTGIEVVRARMDLVEMEESYETARYEKSLAHVRFRTTAGDSPAFARPDRVETYGVGESVSKSEPPVKRVSQEGGSRP